MTVDIHGSVHNKKSIGIEDQSVLTVDHLRIASGNSVLVSDLSYALKIGETLAIVGESGSGKSISSLALLGLLPDSLSVSGDAVLKINDKTVDLPIQNNASQRSDKNQHQMMKAVRGAQVGMIFQEPMTALNPLHTVGKQLAESLRLVSTPKAQLKDKAIALLEDVNIKDAASKLARYPHELSGGQRQRVMIAMALAQNPNILIADEPTTALDVTLQHDVLELLDTLKRKHGMAMILISHDLNLVRRYSDDIVVMQAGKVIEQGNSEAIFENPNHAYTQLLIHQDFGQALPISESAQSKNHQPVITVHNLTVKFAAQKTLFGSVREWFVAVDQVGFTLTQGQALGIVGESGSGKTTIALAITRLLSNDAYVDGKVEISGIDINSLSKGELQKFRSTVQMVFQDPFASINPRFTVMQIVEEGLLVQGIDKTQRQQSVVDALQTVQLPVSFAHRYPHELSGGQRQRVALARALVMRPKVIILDEPTSALDSSTQVAVTALLRQIQHEFGISYIFISHDLKVVRALCQHIMVMQAGRCVEYAATNELFDSPQNAYTQALIVSSKR